MNLTGKFITTEKMLCEKLICCQIKAKIILAEQDNILSNPKTAVAAATAIQQINQGLNIEVTEGFRHIRKSLHGTLQKKTPQNKHNQTALLKEQHCQLNTISSSEENSYQQHYDAVTNTRQFYPRLQLTPLKIFL